MVWKGLIKLWFVVAWIATITVTADRDDASIQSESLLQFKESVEKKSIDMDKQDKMARKKVKKVKPQKASFPELCDATIVQQQCHDMKDGIDDASQGDELKAKVLVEELSTNITSIHNFFKFLGLEGNATTCTELCNRCVQKLSEFSTVPPSSDVACYTDNGMDVCDLDVSPDTLGKIKIKGANFHNDAKLPKKPNNLLQGNMRFSHLSTKSASLSQDPTEPVTYNTYELLVRALGFFRIYPNSVLNPETSQSLVEKSSSKTQQCQTAVNRVNAKTKAWVTTVITKVTNQQTRQHMITWFGNHQPATRQQVLKDLNSIDEMLGSVEYILPGPQCESNVYGYVYPHGNDCTGNDDYACKKKDGKYVIYLCQLFCDSSETVQIETVAHEGAHHGAAYLDDVPPNPYGRETCKEMARKRPLDALKNADNMCYYVADVASGASTPTSAPVPPTNAPVLPTAAPAPGPQQPTAAPAPPGDSCEYANDDYCDVPEGYCLPGTDDTDCEGDTCVFAHDGVCDVPESCNEGTDDTDCSGERVDLSNSCQYAYDGVCDVPLGYCSEGTDDYDCGR